VLGQRDGVVGGLGACPDEHRHPSVDLLDDDLAQPAPLIGHELVRLGAHSEEHYGVDPAREREANDRPLAVQVECPVVQEGCAQHREDAGEAAVRLVGGVSHRPRTTSR
jgi:hypothetical protein